MRNFVKIFFLTSILMIPLLFAGCSGQNSNSNQAGSGQEEASSRQITPPKIEGENIAVAALADLKVGDKVLVMGSEGEGGSIICSQIIIGQNPGDFTGLGGNFTRNRMGTGTPQQAGGEENTGRFDPGQFQDMTEEERAAFRENMPQRDWSGGPGMKEEDRDRFMQERGDRQAAGRTGPAGIARAAGEILDMDNGMLTLKLQDGGSKLVFYSDKTIVNIIK